MSISVETAKEQRLQYTGNGLELSGLAFTTCVGSLFTLGVYLPVGLGMIRRYVWQHTLIDGAPLHYDGTAKSLWDVRSTASKVSLLLFLTMPLSWLWDMATLRHVRSHGEGKPYHRSGLSSLQRPWSIYGGSQYRLHYTSYQGVRFSLDGDVSTYAKMYWWRLFLAVITLGYLYPQFAIATARYALEHTKWGDTSVTYTGSVETAAPLYRKGILFCILTCGLYSPWFCADVRNYHFSRLGLGKIQVGSHQTGKGLLALWTGNFFIALLSLGLLGGVTHTRSLRYIMQTTSLTGTLDVVPAQGPTADPNTGLSDLLAADAWIV